MSDCETSRLIQCRFRVRGFPPEPALLSVFFGFCVLLLARTAGIDVPERFYEQATGYLDAPDIEGVAGLLSLEQ